MRVGELRSVRVRDIHVRTKSAVPMLDFDYQTRSATPAPNHYLEIDLQKSKVGPHPVVTRTTMSGVETFRSLVKRKNLKPENFLFEPVDKRRDRKDADVDNRGAFTELLIAAGLRNANGMKRNLKSVRCTGLMLWVLERPDVNLQLLADNAGTSVAMLSQFYIKPLNVKLNRKALVG
jgi:hypothetical protein